MYKLYIQIGGGAYFCHRCGAKGSWYDFKMKIGGYDVVDSMGRSSFGNGGGGSSSGSSSGGGGGYSGTLGRPQSQSQPQRRSIPQSDGSIYNQNITMNGHNQPNVPLPMPSPRLQAVYISNLLDRPDSQESTAMTYLTETRGLTRQTLRKYGVGLGQYNFRRNDVIGKERTGMTVMNSNMQNMQMQFVRADCITFPWIMRASEVHEQEVLRGGSFLDQEGPWQGGKKLKQKDKESQNKSSSSSSSNSKNEESMSGENVQECHEGDGNELEDQVRVIQEPDNNNIDDDGHEEDEERFVLRRIKVRALEQKSWQRLDPPGGGWGLFGWHTVPEDAKEIVLTEGEYDAMAVYQATGRPAVSLPNGCRSLPVEVLPMLERFETIYLWMDSDVPGREGAEQFAKKIGVNRCLLVQPEPTVGGVPPPKDANEALLRGMDLDEMIMKASVLPHERILTFRELRGQVLHEMLNPNEYAGVPVPSLPRFTEIIKGFRRGELTVLTGPTGSGKTTFLGQLSLDFAENGINTLWGSFEIKNTRLMHKLLHQFSRGPLPNDQINKAQVLEVLADRFENLPLYFMKFHGGSDIDDVLDAMEYAAYVHDVEHIILDNMQFMISRNSPKYGNSFDKFDIQDMAVEKFRKFATNKNVHVTLVVHPRKEEEGMKLGISSVYGSAKATQEADNVLILQKDPTNENRKFVEVKKNRYDGTLGHCPLYYQIDSKRYSEDPGAKLPIKNNAANVHNATNRYNDSTHVTRVPPQHFNSERYAKILADKDHL